MLPVVVQLISDYLSARFAKWRLKLLSKSDYRENVRYAPS